MSYSRPQGTYMVFLDCTEWCRDHGHDIQWLLDEGARVGVGYQDGRPFHGPCHSRESGTAAFACEGGVRASGPLRF